MSELLYAGAAAVNVTPSAPQFLYGYPHVERYSTGVHDPLFASALYLRSGRDHACFVANDIIWVPRWLAERARQRIADTVDLDPARIMITATHTHSAPITNRLLSNEADPTVPEPDPKYLQQLEEGIVAAAAAAYAAAAPAEAGFATVKPTGLGTNRRAPEGPRDPEIPVLVVRQRISDRLIAVMWVCSMHPTVLHEDSTVISGDLPGLARRHLHQVLGTTDCPVLHHMGAAGNQSPRRVVRANTLAEADRLGRLLAAAVAGGLADLRFRSDIPVTTGQSFVDLPVREFPPVAEAKDKLDQAAARLERLRRDHAPRAEVRTAEVDWFGAEETLTLSRAYAAGRVAALVREYLPVEIQLVRVGPWFYVGWPAETFVEFALELKSCCPGVQVITLANGELQGYLVTQEAVDEGGYEASNALFQSPQSGHVLVEASRKLLDETGAKMLP